MTIDHKDPRGPGPFNGHPHNRYVKEFREVLNKQHRSLTADQTIAAFVRANMPMWLAEQTLAGLTQAMKNIPAPPRRGKTKLTIIKNGRAHEI